MFRISCKSNMAKHFTVEQPEETTPDEFLDVRDIDCRIVGLESFKLLGRELIKDTLILFGEDTSCISRIR